VRHAILRVISIAMLLGTASCPALQKQLEGTAPPASFPRPNVTFQGATLVEAPSQRQMEAYYCPIVVPDPFGVPGAAAQGCKAAFGAKPSIQDMRVSFDLRFKVENRGDIPVPLAEILTAATVFPEQTRQSLGAVCLKLCAEGDAMCDGRPGPESCRASSSDIRTIDDFQGAVASFLLSQGLAALTSGQPPSFVAPKVAAAGDLEVVVRFSFGPDALLQTMRQVAEQAVEDLKKGRSVTFVIPYKLEGTVWLDAGSLGRVAVSFGPQSGTWTIPTDRLSLPI
jgi:hypothetical protein